MKQLLYISASRDRSAPAEVGDVLEAALRNNPKEGLTGVLVFHDGNFVQVLEGAAEAVERRFRRIRADPRHSFVTVLIEREIETRMFPDWSMGWVDAPPGTDLSGRLRALNPKSPLPDSAADDILRILFAALVGRGR